MNTQSDNSGAPVQSASESASVTFLKTLGHTLLVTAALIWCLFHLPHDFGGWVGLITLAFYSLASIANCFGAALAAGQEGADGKS